MDRRRELGKRQRRSTGVGSKSKMVPERGNFFKEYRCEPRRDRALRGFG